MSELKNFLVTHTAVVGRPATPGESVSPVRLRFYSMVKAESSEAASDQIVTYRDPTFTTTVENVAEVGDTISGDELFALLNHNEVLKEEKL